MPRLSRNLLFGIAGVASLLVLLAAGLFLLVDTGVYKTRLEAFFSQALGLELSMAGPPKVQLFPAFVLTLEDVHLRGKGSEMATAKRVVVGVDLLSLFSDDVRVKSVVLTQPVITLERGSDGRFNFEPSAEAGSARPDQSWPDISVSDGAIAFVDKQYGKGFDASACHGDLRRLRRSNRPGSELLRQLSFVADIACAQIRKEAYVLPEVKLSIDAKDGVFDVKPLTARLFGAPGSGSLRADFSAAVPSYQIEYAITQFSIEEFFRTSSLKQLATGRMDFSASLSTRGTSPKELRAAMNGRVSLRGKDLVFIGSDLDAAFARFETTQSFNLVDVGAMFFAGPLGLLLTKGYDFANLAAAAGGRSEIRTLVSDWKVEHGVAQAQDVAMVTKQNRVALRGGLDFVNDRFDDVFVALIDARGCAKVRQKIQGSFREPVLEKPNVIAALTGPALGLLKKGSELVFGEHCDVFYAGSLGAPK